MIELVEFESKHLDAVMKIERALFPDSAWSAAMFREELELVGQTRAYWVALDGEEVVGYCGLFFLPPDSDVQTIAVAASHQRQGIGRRLLQTMIDYAAARGCEHMLLEVAVGNAAAIDLYERFGFNALGIRPNYYGPGLDSIAMECSDLEAVANG